MTTQFVVNHAGQPVSVLMSIEEYEALLQLIPSTETDHLLNGMMSRDLLDRVKNVQQGKNVVEHALLPDED